MKIFNEKKFLKGISWFVGGENVIGQIPQPGKWEAALDCWFASGVFKSRKFNIYLNEG